MACTLKDSKKIEAEFLNREKLSFFTAFPQCEAVERSKTGEVAVHLICAKEVLLLMPK